MAKLILRIMINAVSIVAAVKFVDGITFTGQWWRMIIVGAVFGVVNSIIKPIVTFFTLPLIIFTLGLFTLVTNGLMLALTAALSDTFNLGLEIQGFWPAFRGALIISIVSMALSWLTGARNVKCRVYVDRHTGKGEGKDE